MMVARASFPLVDTRWLVAAAVLVLAAGGAAWADAPPAAKPSRPSEIKNREIQTNRTCHMTTPPYRNGWSLAGDENISRTKSWVKPF